jgi:hypothetical protein
MPLLHCSLLSHIKLHLVTLLSIPRPLFFTSIMKFTQIIAGLVTANAITVSAIDVYFWIDSDTCHGGLSLQCGGLNPGSCCSINGYDGAYSVSFMGIPTDWRLDLVGYREFSCKTLQAAVGVGSITNYCMKSTPGHRDLKSAKYAFSAKKRDTEDLLSIDNSGDQKCTQPNIMQIADGTQFSLVDLDSITLQELVC